MNYEVQYEFRCGWPWSNGRLVLAWIMFRPLWRWWNPWTWKRDWTVSKKG